MEISVGARDSKLSRKQVEEVAAFFPGVVFKPVFVKTVGDCDRTTSLRDLGRTDFFSKEIDEMQLAGGCRVSIHSAKDLAEVLPKGLVVAAVTRGVGSEDSLVLREGEELQEGCVVATSSLQREERVKGMVPGLRFVDIRGTIEERLEKLWGKEVDGVVIAEAALIRLGLTGLRRVRVPGEGTAMQGRLAVVVRSGDVEMLEMFRGIHHEA